jgi:DsbC/DsbD-like thiol-disulfide interchange protein
MKTLLISLALAAAPFFAALPAQANPYAAYLDAKVLPGWRDRDGHHMAGLELTLAPGWKTYWRSPGSAGIPPSFNWSGSTNLAGVEVVWPRPHVFDLEGLRSIGYKDRVVLPLRITPKDSSKAVSLNGDIQIGICETVCVPMDVHVSAELDANETHRAPAIAAALAARPYSASEGKLRKATCKLSPARDGLDLEARLDMPSAGGDEVTVFETALPDVMISDTTSHREGNTLVSRAKVISYGGPVVIDRSRIRITVLGDSYAVEITGCDAN